MRTRILTAAVMLALFVPILWFSDLILYPIALSLLAAFGCFELLRCLSLFRDATLSAPAVLLVAAAPLAARLLGSPQATLALLAALFFLFALYLFGVKVFRGGGTGYGALTGVLGGSLYLAVAFSSMVLLRDLPQGGLLFLLPFIGSWVCDTFAYFTGRLFGKHKLAPLVSPKKTVEGSLGGILFAVLAFLLYGYILSYRGAAPHYLALALCGLLVSVVSQIGDLALSAIKREYGVKDYSNLFPGHGGVLDRFDSVLATSPLVLFFCLLGSELSFSLFA